MGDSLETLQMAGTADVNLVVSAIGLRTAKVLQEKFGTPYVIGTPNEWLAEDISKKMENVTEQQMEQLSNTQCLNRLSGMQKCDGTKVKDQLSRAFIPEAVYLKDRMQTSAEITLIGEPVTMGSLAATAEHHGRGGGTCQDTFSESVLSIKRM